MPEPITVDQYTAAQLALQVAASVLEGHDLDAMLTAIHQADATGPVLDPSLYRAGHEALAAMADVVRAGILLVDASRRADAHARRGRRHLELLREGAR